MAARAQGSAPDATQLEAAVTVGPRLVERLRGAPISLPRWSSSRSPRTGRARSSRSRSPTGRRCAPTSSASETFRLEIDGADLADLGLDESPRVGEILAELRRRKLNGELDGRDSELAAARELLAQ